MINIFLAANKKLRFCAKITYMNVMDDFRAITLRRFRILTIAIGSFVVTLLLTIHSPASAKRAPEYTPGTLSACDGTGVSGLVFGKSTAQSVKDSFTINKRNDVPRSLRLVTPRSAGLIVHALFAGKADTGPLTGVLIEYTPGNPYLSAVQQDIGSEGVSYYPQTRYEDWWIQVFAKQGLVAFVFNPGAPQVQAIFAYPNGALDNALDGYSTDKSTISTLTPPPGQAPNPIQIGNVAASSDTTGFIIIDDTLHAIESDMKSDTAAGSARYWAGGPGTYTVKFTGSYVNATGGIISASAVISGPGPGGVVSGEASSSRDIPANTSDFGRYARDAASDARALAQTRFNDNLRNSNPPTLNTFRTSAWNDLIERLRFASDAVVLNPKTP